jgi:hypothetical protein
MRKEELITWAGPRSGLMSQVVQQEALIRLLAGKEIFTKEEFLEMVKTVDRERKRGKRR